MTTPVRLASVSAAVAWLRERVQGTLRTDSRRVQPGDAFIAWPGYARDGREFVSAALLAGAAACLVEDEGVEAFDLRDDRVATLQGLKAATGPLADLWFERPSQRLKLIATTGTNGKSSTAWWTAQALTLLGQRCGVVGTLGVGVPPTPRHPAGEIESTGLTTPDPVTLQASLRRFVDTGHYACAIEASSIGIVEHRLDGARIAVVQYTNFTRDHLDYHLTMEAYWTAKRALFAWPGLKAVVINVDDEYGQRLADELARGHLDLWTTSMRDVARLSAVSVGYRDGGLAFDMIEGDARVSVRSTLIGDYNVSNLLGVMGALRAVGIPLADAAGVAPQLTPVPGRMQRLGGEPDVPEVVVDYAHTPDALEKALLALRPLAASRGGRLWCVFGCGGNRDASKRPLMGGIAQRLADHVVVTSDNPRHEAPVDIIDQILAGATGTPELLALEDRRAAIALAVGRADARDVVLIAGKGHEDYQEIAGERLPFSDAQVALAALDVRVGA